MAIIDVYVKDASGNPVQGASVKVVGSIFCTGAEDGQIWGTGITNASGYVRITMNDLWGICGASCAIVKVSKGSLFVKTNPILSDSSCNLQQQNVVLGSGNVPIPPAPQFQVVELWVKQMNNGNLVRAYNMLEIGSPESGHTHTWPVIPEWTQDQGDYNLQIEATVKNITTQTLNVRFRTQSCPRNTSGLPPMPEPPCGQLVDSGASVSIAPGETKLLPVWQLRMWSDNIDEHNEIVDVNGTVYNAIVLYWDNLSYRADDFYTPINSSGGAGTFSITVHTQDQSGNSLSGATVDLD